MLPEHVGHQPFPVSYRHCQGGLSRVADGVDVLIGEVASGDVVALGLGPTIAVATRPLDISSP